jgi:hypothetical protein
MTEITYPTHADLVQRAIYWLWYTRRCRVVMAGCQGHYSGEIPDALGWRPQGQSHLIECKVRRDDLTADRLKLWRRAPARGVGMYRWFMWPPGMVEFCPDMEPITWGVLLALPRSVRILRRPTVVAHYNYQRELRFLMGSRRLEKPPRMPRGECARYAKLGDA